jgi:hypothetical protein
MNTAVSVTRRHALRIMAATSATMAAGLSRMSAAEPPAAAKPTLHVYPDYGWLRGFSVVPSWGARIEDAWWNYDGARFREEVALARQVHANCIRLWIEFTTWMADPEKVTANFLDVVKAIAECGMKTMPCIFNRWHDSKFDYGGTYTETLFRDWKPQLDYVRALVTPLASDDRVLIWDLCNEPQAHDQNSDVNKKEFAWLKLIAETVRACGAKQPITIGTMNGKNIETFAPLMDVLCAHPYAHTRAALEGLITGYHAMRKAHGKVLLVNECIPGSLSDATRAEVARFYTELLSAAGFGWMGWALREGKAISTRRDRYDGNGINKEGFHPFFTKSGKLRGGLEFLTEKPKLRAPWEES